MSSTSPTGLPPLPATAYQKCASFISTALRSSPRIHVLVNKLEALGCPMPATSFVCEDIFEGAKAGGAYDAGSGRVVMNPRVPPAFVNQGETTRTLTHELIHAYDNCRVHLEEGNCAHLACTEVRAANLSGDCDFMVEAGRAPLQMVSGGMGGAQQRCVRRRAELSLAMHPHCNTTPGQAARTVDAVWKPCYADPAPFSSN
jgi:inner membrane protease ATP23